MTFDEKDVILLENIIEQSNKTVERIGQTLKHYGFVIISYQNMLEKYPALNKTENFKYLFDQNQSIIDNCGFYVHSNMRGYTDFLSEGFIRFSMAKKYNIFPYINDQVLDLYNEVYSFLVNVANYTTSALSLYLNSDRNSISKLTTLQAFEDVPSQHIFRVNQYNAINADNWPKDRKLTGEQYLRLYPHVDLSLLTVSLAEPSGALEFLSEDGSTYEKYPYIENTLLIHAGKYLELLSQGADGKQIKAAEHRVVCKNTNLPRYSYQMFYDITPTLRIDKEFLKPVYYNGVLIKNLLQFEKIHDYNQVVDPTEDYIQALETEYFENVKIFKDQYNAIKIKYKS